MTVLITAALLATGAQVSFALPDPTTDTTIGTAAGTTGPQTCPTPKLKGLPKSPKFTNATIHFKLINVTPGSVYIVRAGDVEVLGATAVGATVKNKFLLPDQGTHDGKVVITTIVDVEDCENAPWKLQKKILYQAVTTPAAAPGAPAAGTPAVAPATPVKVPTPKPIAPAKLPKSITQQLPSSGPPPQRRAWLTPIDSGARLDQKLAAPVLSRLDQKTDEANSTNALIGLGIVGGLFAISTVGGFIAFRRRDEVQFEAAMTEQLKHLEEGDPGYEFGGDAEHGPMIVPEEAPFAEGVEQPAEVPGEQAAEVPGEQAAEVPGEQATTELPATPGAAEIPAVPAATELPAVPAAPEPPAIVPVPAPVAANGASAEEPVPGKPPDAHRAEVEAELGRILNEAGLEAELEGILGDARKEAERHGIALDADLMVQALCEEINGSAKLSDPKRNELRSMFAEIIAEESQHAPAEAHHVPAEGEKIPTP